MNTPITRRRFIAGAGCLCGGVALASQFDRFALAGEKRLDMPATCVDGMLQHLGQKDCWSALQAVGAEGLQVDFTGDFALPSLFHPTTKYTLATPAGIEQLATDAKAAGQQITSFCMHNRFDEQPEVEIKWCSELARVAQALNVPVIRIDVVPAKLARPEFLKHAVQTLSKVIAATESTGVAFAVENHSNTTNDPTFLNPLFDGVGSKRLGLTLDTGNFYWFGHPLSKVYELVEEFAPRVFHTHCKNIRYPVEEREKQRPMGWKYDEYGCPIDRGDIDYARVAAILHKAGYHHDLCVENEFLGKLSAAEATETLAKELQLLKRARSAVSDT
jgi:sugar phosphate isomerase/epimerase